MDFDKWWDEFTSDIGPGMSIYAEGAARSAFDNRQALIDAHNKRCEGECFCAVQFRRNPKERCPSCPLAYIIED